MPRVKALAATAVAVVGFMAGAGTAHAWTYGPLSIVDGDVGKVGEVKGDFNQLTNGTGVGGTHKRYDTRPGGSGIYVDISYQFTGGACTSASPCATYADQTGRWFKAEWSGEYEEQRYLFEATSVRGVIKGCMDKSWVTDPCSARAYKTYSY